MKEEKVKQETVNGPEEKLTLKGIEDEGNCGWASFQPACLQRFNNPAGYLCVYSMFLVTQGLLVYGYTNVILSTLERRFRLQSFQAGLIVISYDVGYFVLCLFVTYYGNKGHRPRMLAISSVVFGIGSLVFSIPHYTTGLYSYGSNYSDLCVSTTSPPSCNDVSNEADQLDNYLYVFALSMILQGFGSITIYTVGFTVIEDSLPKDKSALYLGLANAITILGPCLGYALGGLSLTVYVDFDTLEPDEIVLVPSDPRWVGAWWVGYLITTLLTWVLVSIPMSGFPKQFPGSAVIRSMKESEVHVGASEDIVERDEFGNSIKDLPKAAYLLCRNAPFLFVALAGCSEGFIVSAFTAFLPKLIQTQFSLTSAEAGLYTGLIAVPGGIIGMLISPIIINRWKLRTSAIIKLCIICCGVVIVITPVCLFHCPTTEVAGATVPYSGSSTTGNLSTTCNADCNCQGEYFSPVCGSDNLTYFSACFAGCKSQLEDEKLTDCSCVTDGISVARYGLCNESCAALVPFLCLFFIIVMINFMTGTPMLLITMRCVPESQKAFAIGIQFCLARPLGTIPGPIVFGLIFDVTCELWQESECSGEQGSCWIHNSEEVAIYLLIASLLCKVFSAIMFSSALYTYKPVANVSEIEETGSLKFEDCTDENSIIDGHVHNLSPADTVSTEL